MSGLSGRDDLIYLASVLDCEGTIGVYEHVTTQSNPGHRVRLMVANTDPVLIDWLHSVFGGQVSGMQRRGNRKYIWFWQLEGSRVGDLLALVAPFLKLKAKQAQIVVAVLRIKDAINAGQIPAVAGIAAIAKLHGEMRRLNQRGVA